MDAGSPHVPTVVTPYLCEKQERVCYFHPSPACLFSVLGRETREWAAGQTAHWIRPRIWHKAEPGQGKTNTAGPKHTHARTQVSAPTHFIFNYTGMWLITKKIEICRTWKKWIVCVCPEGTGEKQLDYCRINAITELVSGNSGGFRDYWVHVTPPCSRRGSCSLPAVWWSTARWPRARGRSPWAMAPSSASARSAWFSAWSGSAEKRETHAHTALGTTHNR